MTSNNLLRSVVVAVSLLPQCVGCDQSRPEAALPPASSVAPLLSPPVLSAKASEVPPGARTTAAEPAERSGERSCSLAARVPPQHLLAEWPARLGQRVRLACRVVRAEGVTEYIVAAEGMQFIAVAEPGFPPCGPSTSSFIVTGSTRVHDRGRTSMPELLVDRCGW